MQNTDTVPAMLTPGEFVIRKDAADQIGPENLHMLNNVDRLSNTALLENAKSPMGYQEGGVINEYQQGGQVMNYQNGGQMNDVLSVFGEKSKQGDEMQKLMATAAIQQMQRAQQIQQAVGMQEGGYADEYQQGGEVSPTWGERFVSRFPSRHEDPERVAEQQRALSSLIDFFAPQSTAKAGLMLAAGPVAGKAIRGGMKALPKLSKKAQDFLKKTMKADLEKKIPEAREFAGPIDWKGTYKGSTKRATALDEYGRLKRAERDLDIFEGKSADEIAGALGPRQGAEEFMEEAFESGLDLAEALAARKRKFGYAGGGYIPQYQQGGTVQPPMPSPEAGPQEVPMSGGDQTYHKPAMEQLDMDQYEYQSYIKYGPDMYKWMAQNYKPKTEWTAYDSLVDAGTIDPYEVSKDSLNIMTDDQMDALREKMNKPSGIDRLLQAIGMRK